MSIVINAQAVTDSLVVTENISNKLGNNLNNIKGTHSYTEFWLSSIILGFGMLIFIVEGILLVLKVIKPEDAIKILLLTLSNE